MQAGVGWHSVLSDHSRAPAPAAYSWQYDDAASGFACNATPVASAVALRSAASTSRSAAARRPRDRASSTSRCNLAGSWTRATPPRPAVCTVRSTAIRCSTFQVLSPPGSDWSQYGATVNPSNCGLTNPPGSAIHALALVITILNPNYDAYLGVSDINDLTTTLSTVALNYTQGQGLSTMYLVPQVSSNNIYFALPAQLSANLLFDVVGYAVIPDATALQCTTQSSAASTIAGSGGTGSATSPACAAGYTLTSGSCDSDSDHHESDQRQGVRPVVVVRCDQSRSDSCATDRHRQLLSRSRQVTRAASPV